ncbi:hypothetical protein [Phenylobacterium sp.]|jgi:hypothetical protein|uniref:hypothetical protein n=1 Tax=Phenylobacterium sp. TaxID=1871053 RepID=UPI003784BF2D
MPAYTLVTTTATQGSDEAEVNTLVDDFANVSEAIGYARRMADELLGLAGQLSLDFDYSNVGLYDGDLIDQEPDPEHAAFIGMCVLDDGGAIFIGAQEMREGGAEVPTDAD